MSDRDSNVSLDDLYYMVAHIYSDQNAERSVFETFTHLVEVCSLLTMWETHKRRGGIDMETGLCKALAWFFPLAAKLRIHSLEDIIFSKYPRRCPYCQRSTHVAAECSSAEKPDYGALRRYYQDGWREHPSSLDEWQGMFGTIYSRDRGNRLSPLLLFEEIGELAEAVRAYDRDPSLAFGEMADVFSYIMGLANEYKVTDNETFSFGLRFIQEYPGVCRVCEKRICRCSPDFKPRAAKEAPIDPSTDIVPHPLVFAARGAEVALLVAEEFPVASSAAYAPE